MLPIPTTAGDIQAVNRLLRLIRIKAADGTINPIVRRLVANTASSDLVENTVSETNYSLNETITTELLRAGYCIHVIASGIHSNSGAGSHTIRFRVKFGSTNIVQFASVSLAGSSSNAAWTVDVYIVVKTTGSSGTVLGHGKMSIYDTTTLQQDIQASNTPVSVDTTTDQTLQISVQHGVANTDTESRLTNFVVEIQQ